MSLCGFFSVAGEGGGDRERGRQMLFGVSFYKNTDPTGLGSRRYDLIQS